MRDPDRIPEFLAIVQRCWEKVPDWRFGQLMMNFLGWVQNNKRDPFFPEEDQMLEYLKEYANTYSHLYRGW